MINCICILKWTYFHKKSTDGKREKMQVRQKMITLQLLLTISLPPDKNIKWDHFEILASGKTDYHCKIKETLFIQDLN